MNPLPRTGSYLIDSMLFAVGAICFTLAVGLVVIVGALLIQATMLVSEPYVGSRSAASVLALVVFAAYVGVPSYLIATFADDSVGRDDAANTADPRDRREEPAADEAADDQTVTADLGAELRSDGADTDERPGDEHRPGAARCDGARPEGGHGDRPDGEGQ